MRRENKDYDIAWHGRVTVTDCL